MLLHSDGFPRVVDVVTVDPELGHLFWVKLSTENWIVFSLDRSDKMGSIWHLTVSSHIPKISKTFVSFKDLWRKSEMVAIVSEVVGLKFEGAMSKRFVHFCMHGVLDKFQRKTHFVIIEDVPGLVSGRCCVANQLLVSKTCTPSWIEVALIVIFYDLVKNKLSKIIVITVASWEEHTIKMLQLFESDFFWLTVDNWNNSCSLALDVLDVGRHHVRGVVGESWIWLHIVFESLGKDADNWLLVKVDVFLPVFHVAPW